MSNVYNIGLGQDIGIRKSEFVGKIQFLYLWHRTKGMILIMDLKCKSKPEKILKNHSDI